MYDYGDFTKRVYFTINGEKISYAKYCENSEYYDVFLKEQRDYLDKIHNTEWVITETLIDHFYHFLEKDLLVSNDNLDEVTAKIMKFVEKNNIKLHLEEKPVNDISGYYNLQKNLIHIIHPPEKYLNIKNLLLVILHELSHYITHKSSSKRLIKFIVHPNPQLNLVNIKDVINELDYLLTPNESANWAFSLAIELFQNNNINLNKIYDDIIKDIKLNNLNPRTLDISNHYKNLTYFTQSIYKIIFLIEWLYAKPNLDVHIIRGYELYLKKLFKLTNKYLKRLNKLFTPNRKINFNFKFKRI